MTESTEAELERCRRLIEPIRREREEHALDAIIASFYVPGDSDVPIEAADPGVLTDEDRAALNALGDDLIDRLIAARDEEHDG